MPRRSSKKTSKRPAKPRTTYRRKRIYKRKTTGPFKRFVRMDPFPASMKCKLTYTHTSGLSSGTVGVIGTEQVFRLNSLYDPDFTGSGHQPYGFDQVSSLYKHYQVYGVKVSVTCTDPTLDANYVAAMFQPSTATYTLAGKDQDQVRENPLAITRVLNNTGSQITRFSQYFPIYKLEGITPVQYSASMDLYSADVSTNPSLTPFFRIGVGNMRGNASQSVMCVLTFTFYCRFTQRVIQSQS